MSIAENIKKLRESHGLNQAEFGRIASVSDKAVSTWENGLKIPRMGAVQKLADHFGISKSDILDDEPDPNRFSNRLIAFDDPNEVRLVELYRELNDEGQGKLVDYADDLVTSGKYIKTHSPGLDQSQA